MTTTFIQVAMIDVHDRIRPVDETHAAHIAASYTENGQQTPIMVRAKAKGRYSLVFGSHRLRAAQINKMELIEAKVFEGSADQARMAEIDENLVRHELNVVDRAAFLAERKRLYEKMHPEAKHGGDRRSAFKRDIVTLLNGRFTADAIDKLGFSEKTLKRWLARHTKLEAFPKAMRDKLAGTVLARSAVQLDAFLGLGDFLLQQRVLGEMADHADPARNAESFESALARVRPRNAPVKVGAFERFLVVWRASERDPDARARILDHIVAEGEVCFAGRNVTPAHAQAAE